MDPRECILPPASDGALLLDAAGRGWSGQDLRKRSWQLAGWLRERDVGPGDRVVIHVSRSRKVVTDLLGVWLCGATAVPLPARAPSAYVARLVRRIQPRWIITDAARADRFAVGDSEEPLAEGVLVHAPFDLPGGLGVPGAVHFRDVNQRGEETGSPPTTEPDQPALVVAVSGAEGRPRLVTISWQILDHTLREALGQDELATAPVVATTSLASHHLLSQIVAPLWRGCSLTLGEWREGEGWPVVPAADTSSTLCLPGEAAPSLAQHLDGCAAAQIVWYGWLDSQAAAILQERHPTLRQWQWTEVAEAAVGHLRRLPLEGAGEEEPDGALPGALRWWQGWCWEPAEIEEALRRHPAVEGATVQPAVADGPCGPAAACVRVRKGSTFSAVDLWRFLARELPPWLVPSCIEEDCETQEQDTA